MRLLPRDEKFFDMFSAVAAIAVESAGRALQELLRADASHRTAIVDQIKRLEHEADQITHEVVTRLDGSSSLHWTGRTSTSWPPGWTTSLT